MTAVHIANTSIDVRYVFDYYASTSASPFFGGVHHSNGVTGGHKPLGHNAPCSRIENAPGELCIRPHGARLPADCRTPEVQNTPPQQSAERPTSSQKRKQCPARIAIHTDRQTHKQTNRQTDIQTDQAHVRTYVCTHIHTYIHTYIQLPTFPSNFII